MSAWQKFWRESHLVERAVIVGSSAAILFFGGYLLRTQSQSTPLPPLFQEAPAAQLSTGSSQAGSPSPSSKTSITVHVIGAVVKPGVEVLPANARVADAIRVAGGATKTAQADSLNLAAHLEDGQQIRVPTRAEAAASTQTIASTTDGLPSGTPTTGVPLPASNLSNGKSSTHPARLSSKKPLPIHAININTSSAANLTTLPGIGPALAARIVGYRAQHGRFSSIDDLDNVSGIGPKKLEELRPYISF